jgi:hypothetical protein
MSWQIFANHPLDRSPERTRHVRRKSEASGIQTFIRGIDRDTFYLAVTGLVGSLTICVFFGLGFYTLDRPTAQTVPNPATHQEYAEVQASAKEESVPSPGETPTSSVTVAPPSSEGTTPEKAKSQDVRPPEPVKFSNASSETLTGTVTEAADAMTWVVAKTTVRLWGVRPALHGLAPSLVSFVEWVRTKGPLECRKHAHSNRYRCSTPTGEDLAEAALLAGLGRAAEGASPNYRDAEAKARRQGKGLWAKL